MSRTEPVKFRLQFSIGGEIVVSPIKVGYREAMADLLVFDKHGFTADAGKPLYERAANDNHSKQVPPGHNKIP